jgi:hypothetical protein
MTRLAEGDDGIEINLISVLEDHLEATLVIVGVPAVLLERNDNLSLRREQVSQGIKGTDRWSHLAGAELLAVLGLDFVRGVDILATPSQILRYYCARSERHVHHVIGAVVEGPLDIGGGLLA